MVREYVEFIYVNRYYLVYYTIIFILSCRIVGPPKKPSNLEIIFNNESQVILSWDNVTCADVYQVNVTNNTNEVYNNNCSLSPLFLNANIFVNITAVYSYTVSGIDSVGRIGLQSVKSSDFTLSKITS